MVRKKKDGQRGSDQQQVFQGVALFLAASMERLFSRVRGARDGPLGAIMAKRGGVVSVASGCAAVPRAIRVPSIVSVGPELNLTNVPGRMFRVMPC